MQDISERTGLELTAPTTNEFGDRNIAMAMANSSYIQQIKDDTGTEDEFGMFPDPTWR